MITTIRSIPRLGQLALLLCLAFCLPATPALAADRLAEVRLSAHADGAGRLSGLGCQAVLGLSLGAMADPLSTQLGLWAGWRLGPAGKAHSLGGGLLIGLPGNCDLQVGWMHGLGQGQSRLSIHALLPLTTARLGSCQLGCWLGLQWSCAPAELRVADAANLWRGLEAVLSLRMAAVSGG